VARLDKLIQVMQEQRAEALQLAVGKPASLMQNGSARPITRDPLNEMQIQGLLREIASAEAASQLGSSETVAFEYRSPEGDVRVGPPPKRTIF
jgi:Tfp pilus assembly ATPase PilU